MNRCTVGKTSKLRLWNCVFMLSIHIVSSTALKLCTFLVMPPQTVCFHFLYRCTRVCVCVCVCACPLCPSPASLSPVMLLRQAYSLLLRSQEQGCYFSSVEQCSCTSCTKRKSLSLYSDRLLCINTLRGIFWVFLSMNVFDGVRLDPRPTPNLVDQGVPFRLGHHLWLLWHGKPYQ